MIPRPDGSPSATDFNFGAYGTELDVKKLAESCCLQFDAVWPRGPNRSSGSFEVYISPDRLPPGLREQADLAAAFLEKNQSEIRKIVGHPDVEGASIRFLLHDPDPCVYVEGIHETRLFEALSRLNVGLTIMVHPPQNFEPIRHPGRGDDDS